MSNKYEKMFNPAGLRVPKRLAKRRLFCTSGKIVVPKELFLDGYCTGVENQGSKPWCAAYSASTFAENVLWRKNGYPPTIDPAPIYAWAKQHDGDPDGDGTTLDKALEALCALGYFNGDRCKVKMFGGDWFGLDPESAILKVKTTLHRHGTCIIGCDIDGSWYTPVKGVVKGGGQSYGGHAVTPIGYDEGGILIRNSWGSSWGHEGNAYIPNSVFKKQFMYGAVLTHCFDGLA